MHCREPERIGTNPSDINKQLKCSATVRNQDTPECVSHTARIITSISVLAGRKEPREGDS